MINVIFEWLNHVLAQDIYLATVAAFLWGILSVLLSPCHLASLPLIIGYINRNGISSIRSASMTDPLIFPPPSRQSVSIWNVDFNF